jgi:lysophospholipase L1-like esterase
MISNIYPYNSSVFYLGRNNPNELIEEHHKKGFVESYREWNFPRTVEKETNDAFEYNQKKLDAYKELLTICKTKHIKLYVVVSPYYEDINNRLKKMIQITKTIAAEQQIDFFDHSQDTTFTNHGFLFSDVSHLNGKGAQIFSKIIAGKIKEQSKNITSTLANNK